MARISTVIFQGRSGNRYEFDVWPIDQDFNDVGTVYAVTLRSENNQGGYGHDIIYVGQTDDLKARFSSHHKASCFTRHKANCICTHRDNDEDSRLGKESDLVDLHKPVCNY